MTEDCVAFLQRLIRIRSLPGEEGEVAELVSAEMGRLGFDRVETDQAGNVLGRIRGEGEAPEAWFVTHLDHVDAGDESSWAHPPFGGEVHDGRVWGRGAVDIKGPLAAQVHGVARSSADGPPPGDVVVAALVQEEVGGLGARYVAEHSAPELAVVGEPSSNELRRGHRGRAELVVHARGESVHASAPGRGANPLEALGGFLTYMRDVVLPSHPELGAATVAPTLIRTDQGSANVIPGEAWLTCDCRLIPGQTAESIAASLRQVMERHRVPGVEVEIRVPTFRRESWTGLEMEMAADNPAYLLPADDPAVQAAVRVLTRDGERPRVGVWRFATDGGRLARAGTRCVGFGPGDEELAHTVRESVEVDELAGAMEAYRRLARQWPAAWVELREASARAS